MLAPVGHYLVPGTVFYCCWVLLGVHIPCCLFAFSYIIYNCVSQPPSTISAPCFLNSPTNGDIGSRSRQKIALAHFTRWSPMKTTNEYVVVVRVVVVVVVVVVLMDQALDYYYYYYYYYFWGVCFLILLSSYFYYVAPTLYPATGCRNIKHTLPGSGVSSPARGIVRH